MHRTCLSLATSLVATLAHAQSADHVLCDRLATPRTRAQYRPQAEARIAAGGPAADFFRGCLVWDEDRSDASIKLFEAATQAPTATSDHFLWLGNAYGVKAQRSNVITQGRLAGKVKNAFDRAVQLDPTNVAARDGLMQYYLQAPGIMGGSITKAEEQARSIKKLNAYRGGFALASVLARRKDAAGAERELAGVYAAFPDSIDALGAAINAHAQQSHHAAAWALLDGAQKGALATHPRLPFLIGRAAALSGEQLERGEAALLAYLRTSPGPDDPRPTNAQLRLGQIYEKMGKTEQARAAYRTALALDGRNEAAKRALKTLGG
ncbi:MAG: tetratricopeptide repeat protein [Gemmatimonadaceae bacterium]|jgi:tetratricopeptide (TPR) repeat protein|nr:tetratricopeptide repeat protein [Gemmatimonadaceae bacterium]